jgi:hypothetical protein
VNIMYRVSLFFLLLISCTQPEIYKETNVIPEDTVINILTNLYIADASMNLLAADNKKFTFKTDDYYYSVLKKFKTDRKKFTLSMEYYSKDPVRLEKIFDKVLQQLSIMQGNVTDRDSVIKSNKPQPPPPPGSN